MNAVNVPIQRVFLLVYRQPVSSFIPDDRIVARGTRAWRCRRGEREVVSVLMDSVKKRRGGRSEVFLCLWPESSHNQLTEDKKTGEAMYDTEPHVAGSEIQNRGRNKVQHSAKEEEKINEKMLVAKTNTCRHVLLRLFSERKSENKDEVVTIDGKGKEEVQGSVEHAKIKGRAKTRRKDNWKSARQKEGNMCDVEECGLNRLEYIYDGCQWEPYIRKFFT
ncbi:hypothetical protein EI94DRAFT_1700088 [Lactarius quietus]|nr:hypothetical protein EI94DRAFT_1700088 [Lactarius quietus]